MHFLRFAVLALFASLATAPHTRAEADSKSAASLPSAASASPPSAPSASLPSAPSASLPSASQDTSRTLVFVVRHAEKSTTVIGADPPLNEAGRRRAGALARALGDANVRTIYVTKFARSRETADSLVARTGAEIRLDDQNDPTALAQRIRAENAGQTALVVGHSDTVPAIVTALCGRAVPPFREGEWDVLYLVTLPRHGEPTVLRLHYGD